MSEFWRIDLPALAAAALACGLCGFLGNFLVLRRESLLGDAIAHAVLPGIVVGFMIAGTLAALPMLAGALAAALIAAGAIQLVRNLGRIEPGAAMGAVFTIMFAGGVVLLERASLGNAHIDADCVLYGQLEDILWLGAPRVADLPREIWTLAGVLLLSAALAALFAKEVRLALFDPDFAEAIGLRPRWIHAGIIALVAMAAIASFEAVGSILVIAMLICPAAAARLLTDSYRVQLLASTAIAVASAPLGYVLAGFGPGWFGHPWSLSAAGMIACVSGLAVAAAALAGRFARRAAEPSRIVPASA